MPAASRPEDPGSTRGAPRSAGSAPRGFGQLALELDLVAGEPRLPADIRPMQPRPVSRLPDDGRHLYDPSWGGVRVLAFVQSGTVRLLASRGRDLTARVPEVVEGLSAAAAGTGPCLFDGELVA